MKLLITGGTGFIGSRLALTAHKRGIDVVVTGQVNNDGERTRKGQLEAAGLRVVLGSIRDPECCRLAAADRTVVIHLAAAQHEGNVPASYFRSVNVDGTACLLDACATAGIKRFVYGSTIGVYGAPPATEIDETTQPHPENAYGRSKLEGEELVRRAGTLFETVIARISEVYGPGDLRLLKLFRAVDRGRFMMIGTGLNRHQVIHVDDLCRGLLLVTDHPAAASQTFVLAGREVLTTRDLVAGVAAAVDRHPARFGLPLWPFKLGALILEKTLAPLGIQPPLHRRRLDFFIRSFQFSTRRARDLLGFEPQIPFADGVRATAHWYRENGWLGGGRR